MAVRKWTWQCLALLGLLGLIFSGVTYSADLYMELTVPIIVFIDEPVEQDDPDEIPVFYDYPWSDVALAKREGPEREGCIEGYPPSPPPFNPFNHPLI